jgi:serine/threonine-protein kinase
MGTVYRAEHVLLERPAAVKLLRPDLTANPSLVQRFFNEAKAVTACKHPGIVEVYDFDYAPDGRAFFVMELLEGETLARRLSRARLAEAEVAVLAHGIASALKAAHRVGVVHRDLKPDNVFLVPDPDGGPDRTKVLDFGIAKLAGPSSRGNTQTGTLIGTPLYMAPEQARAAGAIDHRADLYSLGCILYHMLVGRPPFVADGGGEIIALQLFGQAEPPSRHTPVTPEMEQLVLRLLEKDPAARFQNAGELMLALTALDPRLARAWPGTAPNAAEPTPRPGDAATTEDPPRPRSRMPILAGAIAVVAAAAIAFVVMARGDGSPAKRVPASAAVKAAPSPAPTNTPASAATLPTGAPAAQGSTGATPSTGSTTAASGPATSPTDGPAVAGGPAKRIGGKPGEGSASARAGGDPRKAGKNENAGKGEKAANTEKLIEVIHELRPADSPKPGEHSNGGSPIESDVGLDRKRKDPSAP